MPSTMQQLTRPVTKLDLIHPQTFLNRERSWLEFNRRVLHEACDDNNPILERVKFTAIFSSNLDEYFMVRVALLQERAAGEGDWRSVDGLTAQEQLERICQWLTPILIWQQTHFEQTLRPALSHEGICLLNYEALNSKQRAYLLDVFHDLLFPVLTPLAVNATHPSPQISNLSINLAIVLRDRETGRESFARVKVPESFPRFLPLPIELMEKADQAVHWTGIPLEQVIAHHLEFLFPGMEIVASYPFRITRNADLDLVEEEADDLLRAIERNLPKRRLGGSIVRMEIDQAMPPSLQNQLMEELDLQLEDIYRVDGLLGLRDLMGLTTLPLPHLKYLDWSPVPHPRLRSLAASRECCKTCPQKTGEDFFAILRQRDLLVHHPYHSFATSVEQFIDCAAHDPDVLAIKMTLYRTSGDSPIVNSLIEAAQNGKQVAVLVELKARFDEENNIHWARHLERAGVHVVYGLMGLKTHTKTTLVIRREGEKIRRYVHIGTGNYNSKTAGFYTDLGLFSCREDLGADLTELFNYLTGYSRQREYRKLLVAPVNLRERMLHLIRRETANCRAGYPGRIVAKMNGLIDSEIIETLYEASQAGVQIDLIVRGICCLKPGIKGLSDRIRVISIIGRFLEHSRIFYFHNRGQEEVWLGSADWMSRNLNGRVEAIVPIEDPELAKDIQEILGIMLADNRSAWDLQPDGNYVQRHPAKTGCTVLSSQDLLMQMAEG
ncbi:MAG: polyphosphate kinase 1 [Leptolyngbyaceae cyanobacterium bins.59]|nr:polyphosphate kinase 1 [Leptolyngbyaceae cyanobacterium bins.59]